MRLWRWLEAWRLKRWLDRTEKVKAAWPDVAEELKQRSEAEMPLQTDIPPPQGVGWYPTIHCWDAAEGGFPSAHYWDGTKWTGDPSDPQWWTNAHIQYAPERFTTKEEAERYAIDNELGW